MDQRKVNRKPQITTPVILRVGRGGQPPTVPSNLNFQNKKKNKIL